MGVRLDGEARTRPHEETLLKTPTDGIAEAPLPKPHLKRSQGQLGDPCTTALTGTRWLRQTLPSPASQKPEFRKHEPTFPHRDIRSVDLGCGYPLPSTVEEKMFCLLWRWTIF